eukprot:scaffold213354_cov23-Tisochrysis_lutea.AAC.1
MAQKVSAMCAEKRNGLAVVGGLQEHAEMRLPAASEQFTSLYLPLTPACVVLLRFSMSLDSLTAHLPSIGTRAHVHSHTHAHIHMYT